MERDVQRSSDDERLRAELARAREQLDEAMMLIGCTRPEKFIHDLRNKLNELALYRQLVERQE